MRSKLADWKPLELAWLVIATLSIISVSLMFGDNLMGIISALTGLWCVILTAKGKTSSFIVGTINIVLYIIISFQAKFYGEVMLNLLYYLPMQYIGWKMWKNSMGAEDDTVGAKTLSTKVKVLGIIGTVIAIVAYAGLLNMLGGNLTLIDSMSTVLSVVAMYLLVNRYVEQWIVWIFVNVVSIIMWAISIRQGGTDVATLMMWSTYLINSIFGYITWKKRK